MDGTVLGVTELSLHWRSLQVEAPYTVAPLYSTAYSTNANTWRYVAAIYDMNGREASDVESVLEAVGAVGQYIFCSSAGVYLKSDQMPHQEEDATDPASRHKVPMHPTVLCYISPVVAQGALRHPTSSSSSSWSQSTPVIHILPAADHFKWQH